MRPYRLFLTLILICFGTSLFPGKVQAARGIPPSLEFGYGFRINLTGDRIKDMLDLAASLQVDWVAMDLDWSNFWPDPKQQPQLEALDLAMDLAGRYDLAVQLSLVNPPAWARANQAPDPKMTAWFVVNLVQRYPRALKVIELYPGANTRQAVRGIQQRLGWPADGYPTSELLETLRRH